MTNLRGQTSQAADGVRLIGRLRRILDPTPQAHGDALFEIRLAPSALLLG
ncbi:hypothetical protein ACIRQP_23675 [Streptomyces sp. NPDC102274]